jgi:hypothetical protein
MIKVRIGESERELSDATPQWINEQIGRRREDGISVCVQVLINTGSVNLALSTPTCGGGGGSGRPPNPQERELLSLWERLHLNTQDFSSGNLVAFLKQISKKNGG